MNHPLSSHPGLRRAARTTIVCAALLAMQNPIPAASLADQPWAATADVPGNLALALSVEWPTASRTAHTAAYSSASEFKGYFDPNKCYTYTYDATSNGVTKADGSATGNKSYFQPAGAATSHTCTGSNDSKWSGNFLNWAATATIDPFRWAMTGGRRVVDTAAETILEKGWHSGQGLFDDRDLPVSEIAGATPFTSANQLTIKVNGMGFKMRLTANPRTLKGEYYNNTALSGSPTRTVAADSADHIWGSAKPFSDINADNFAARYTGTFVAQETGTYTFRTISDDGVRLYVNDVLIINNWTNHSTTTNDATVTLTKGSSFTVKLEYFDSGADAVIQLQWATPSSPTVFSSFGGAAGSTTAVDYNNETGSGVYDLTMRTKVCDTSAGAGGVESNCKAYGSNYKPEGLLQQYAQKMRFSAFGYLNQSTAADGTGNGNARDGGVLRAQQKFVGPSEPVPLKSAKTNTVGEWNATDGTLVQNPDQITSALGVTIADSGVINYLNKFGQLTPGNYKSRDPVSEMYYAALRYFRNLGNVPEWTNTAGASNATIKTWVDGFPVIATDWKDPIQYTCQRNFVLGIGDIYTHADRNVPGNTADPSDLVNTTPPELVRKDTTVDAVKATDKVGALQGLGAIGTDNTGWGGPGRGNSAYMAGLAYDANAKDIRSDVDGKQTVQTYWVDVLEQSFQKNNQFYLTAKFGGLNVPGGFDPYTFDQAIPDLWWSTSGDTLTDTRLTTDATQKKPDNYFTAGNPDDMISGLKKAFAAIANAIETFTTSFSPSTFQFASSGSASYGAQFNAKYWSGVLSASELTFADDGTPTATAKWSTGTTLETQLAGAGWNTDRRVATWSGSAGIPFRKANLSSTQLATLDTSYVSTDDSENYLNWLRGDRSNERTEITTTKPYRFRKTLLGDVVNAKVTPVAVPSRTFSETVNVGYSNFKTTWKDRLTMVYVAANDGMLHGFNGSLDSSTDANAGKEVFAYVPSALFAKSSSSDADGLLAQLGNPLYSHKYYVDATPIAYDLDFNNAGGAFKTTKASDSDWRTLLIGGLGKGGKGYYAIDVTDPASMTDETKVAAKVKWEFTDSTMGYSYGAPLVVKTKKYGWVAILTSGYNNSDGYGYVYFVNPTNGALLEKVRTGSASDGLTQVTGFMKEFNDGTVDALYVGDLNGQLWRFDVTAAKDTTTTTAYPAPLLLATLKSDDGTAQPITTLPLIEIQPLTRKRFVLVGTGRLLDISDVESTAPQSFYAILDGGVNTFNSATDLPASASFPLTRSMLTKVSDLTAGITLTNISMGWYTELGTSTTSAWRLVPNNHPTYSRGIVAFAAFMTAGNPCSPSGISRIYAIDIGNGKSTLLNTSDAIVSYIETASAITDLEFVKVGNKVRLVAGDSTGKVTNQRFMPPPSQSLRLLNWREVPTVD
ncbi:type IV pilus assembly protein PilY1 [Variovorax sp. CF079]|nr:type IV pilus assembly protein PilY1 [Variovorax sp. CF079]